MVLQPFKHGVLVLSLVVIGLFSISFVKDMQTRSAREADSTFVSLVENEALDVKEISKVEVVLSGGEIAWSYDRVDGLWRLPKFAGAFALNEEVDSLVKILLEGRGRPVGSRLENEAHFGLRPSSRLTVNLFQGDKRTVRLHIGALSPGAAKDERYVQREGDDTIYLFTSNPGVFFDQAEPPVLLDRHILPRALPHAMPTGITFSGSRPHQIRELAIRQLPVAPDKEEKLAKDKNAKRAPTHEFTGTMIEGGTQNFDDGDGSSYINALLNSEFDKIVGSLSPVQIEYRKFDDPVFEVSLNYSNEKSIVLSVSGSLIEGRYPILNRATGQMFIVSSEKVDQLIPKMKIR